MHLVRSSPTDKMTDIRSIVGINHDTVLAAADQSEAVILGVGIHPEQTIPSFRVVASFIEFSGIARLIKRWPLSKRDTC